MLGHLHTLSSVAFNTSHSTVIGIDMESVCPLSFHSFHFSGKPLCKVFHVSVWSFAHSSRIAILRSATDGGREDLCHNLHSSSPQQCLMGLRLGFCAPTNHAFLYLHYGKWWMNWFLYSELLFSEWKLTELSVRLEKCFSPFWSVLIASRIASNKHNEYHVITTGRI